MTTATDFLTAETHDSDLAPYRAVSRAAVVSTLLATVSFLLVATAIMSASLQAGDAVPMGFWGACFALGAAVFGVVATSTIRRFPSEYTGKRLAGVGLAGGLVLFAGGSGISSYTYVTEVPEGYTRIGFWELQPDPDQPLMPIPQKALELSGEKIFIKGYMHPGVSSSGKVNHFILVPDMGTCCFGGQPKPTEMIEVRLRDSAQRVAYSTRKLKLAGTFQMSLPRKSLGLENVVYHLEVDQAK
jgi:hypothetical protein